MSETASQVATETIEDLAQRRTGARVDFRILPHLEARSAAEGRLAVRGSSLLTGYVSLGTGGEPVLWDPKDEGGWLLTEDLGQVFGDRLELAGRTKDRIKIGGEIANLAVLRGLFGSLVADAGFAEGAALLSAPDSRLESVIVVAWESRVDWDARHRITESFNETVMPFERIRRQIELPRIPRTELGKIKWAQLSALLQEP